MPICVNATGDLTELMRRSDTMFISKSRWPYSAPTSTCASVLRSHLDLREPSPRHHGDQRRPYCDLTVLLLHSHPATTLRQLATIWECGKSFCDPTETLQRSLRDPTATPRRAPARQEHHGIAVGSLKERSRVKVKSTFFTYLIEYWSYWPQCNM